MSERHKRNDANGQYANIHGMSHTPIYSVWGQMRRRCKSPKDKSYKRYGGRGIKVCDEWDRSFESFYEWSLANGYHKGLTIDRIDSNGDYVPSNCRWVTTAEQNRNYSRNHMLAYKGETLCLADMADKYGVNRATLLARLKAGWPMDKALSNTDGRSLRWQK